MTSRDCHVVATKRQPLLPSSQAHSRQFTQRTKARWRVSPIPATNGGARIHNSRACTARRHRMAGEREKPTRVKNSLFQNRHPPAIAHLVPADVPIRFPGHAAACSRRQHTELRDPFVHVCPWTPVCLSHARHPQSSTVRICQFEPSPTGWMGKASTESNLDH